jgi:hypothetical protein
MGLGSTAALLGMALAFRKTRGLPRYLLGVAGLDTLRRVFKRDTGSTQRDPVDINSEQSFPASDPPSWAAR